MNLDQLQWMSFETKEELINQLKDYLVNLSIEKISKNGFFSIILAGGTTPENLYQLLNKEEKIDFTKWKIFIGDERCLDANNKDRNSVMIVRSLLNRIDIKTTNFFPINSEKGSKFGADEYNKLIEQQDSFDIALLGLGEDAHTASLFPGHIWNEDKYVVPINNAPKPPADRISLTPKAFKKCNNIIFIVTGAGKTDAINKWKNGDSLPVSFISGKEKTQVYFNLD